MARAAAKATKIYVDEFDYSGITNKAQIAIDNKLPDVTCFGDTWSEFVEAIAGHKCSIGGFFDGDDDAYDEKMWDRLYNDTDKNIGIYMGNSAGKGLTGYEMLDNVESQSRPLAIAGAAILNISWKGDSPVVRSTVLATPSGTSPNGVITATGAVANSAYEVGATAAGESCVAILRVLAVSGSGSATVTVEESSDNGVGDAYATLFTFTAATGVTVERKSTISATEAWKRVNVTAYATFTSISILVVIGKEQGVS